MFLAFVRGLVYSRGILPLISRSCSFRIVKYDRRVFLPTPVTVQTDSG